MSPDYNQSTLESCTSSLRQSVNLLQDSNSLLRETLQDSKRISKILSTNKVFALIPELDLIDAKSNFKKTIVPEINDSFKKLENKLEELSNQKNELNRELRILDLRYGKHPNGNDTAGAKELTDQEIENLPEDEDIDKVRQLKVLRNKRNRLKYTLNQLN